MHFLLSPCMDVLNRTKHFNENWFSGFREILETSFINADHKANADILLQAIKTKEVDSEKIVSKIKNLSEDEWSLKYVLEQLNELNDLLGISDKFLKEHAVTDMNDSDFKEVKWELMKRVVRDYSKFSKEFYDSLKYSRNTTLDRDTRMLMLAIMEALQKVHEASKALTDKYFHKKFNATSLKKFMDVRMPMEQLLFRVYFILLNMDKTEKLAKYRDVLTRELLEFTVQQEK